MFQSILRHSRCRRWVAVAGEARHCPRLGSYPVATRVQRTSESFGNHRCSPRFGTAGSEVRILSPRLLTLRFVCVRSEVFRHLATRAPGALAANRLESLRSFGPALATMENRDDPEALAAHSVRNDVPCAWHNELTSPGSATGTAKRPGEPRSVRGRAVAPSNYLDGNERRLVHDPD